MATRNDEVKPGCPLILKEIKTWKKVTFIHKGSSSQSLDTTMSVDVMKKCNGKKEKDHSSKSKFRSAAYQIDDKALPYRFTGKGEVIQNCKVLASQTDMNSHVSDQGSCAELTSTSRQSESLLYITEEEGELFKKQADKLKRKIKKMSRKLRKYTAKCTELHDNNKLIMEELKKVCQPCAIQMLKAKDPYNNPHTD